jgi:hypothetical protein
MFSLLQSSHDHQDVIVGNVEAMNSAEYSVCVGWPRW